MCVSCKERGLPEDRVLIGSIGKLYILENLTKLELQKVKVKT